MYRAFKFRLYPDNNQKELINKTFGCFRFVYNYYLNKIKNNKYINSYTTSAIYGNYKDKQYCNLELDLINRKIKLPKFKWVDIRRYLNLKDINGKIINTTISREINKYYVLLVIDIPELKYEELIPRNIVSINIGVKELITLSDGTTFDNNKYILKYEHWIKRLQRELSRKVKRSNNYYKCKQKIGILYRKLKNSRKYYLHNITKTITDKYDIIACENLNTKYMIMTKILSKIITNALFNEILRQLIYKSQYKHKHFYQIDTYYSSSQTCNYCSNIDKKYKDIKERIYNCHKCGSVIDRDLNASINIQYE